jgi:hypothetical protein
VPFRNLPHTPSVYAQLHLVFADMDIGAFYLPAFLLGAVVFFFHCLFGFVDDFLWGGGESNPSTIRGALYGKISIIVMAATVICYAPFRTLALCVLPGWHGGEKSKTVVSSMPR